MKLRNTPDTRMEREPTRIFWLLIKYHKPYGPFFWAKAQEKLKQKKIKRLQKNAAALGFKLLTSS